MYVIQLEKTGVDFRVCPYTVTSLLGVVRGALSNPTELELVGQDFRLNFVELSLRDVVRSSDVRREL